MKKIVLIGAGGHCKVIMDIINSSLKYEIVGITDKSYPSSEALYGVNIIGSDDILEQIYDEGVEYAFICVGAMRNIHLRNNLYKRLKDIGYKLPVLIHSKAVVSEHSILGEGTCVMAGAIVNSGAKVGNNSIINTGAIVEHDSIVGNNSHICPGAVLAGNVVIGDNCEIGIGSSIIQGIKIGENTSIGAGSVVIRDVDKGSVAAGVPAKVFKIK